MTCTPCWPATCVRPPDYRTLSVPPHWSWSTSLEVTDPLERRFYCGADAGAIAQNVYLFCAAEGLATGVRGPVDRRALARTLGLGARQRVLLAQTVGFAA